MEEVLDDAEKKIEDHAAAIDDLTGRLRRLERNIREENQSQFETAQEIGQIIAQIENIDREILRLMGDR